MASRVAWVIAFALWCVPKPVGAQASCESGGADADGDGLSDACELVLLERFAPTLVVSARACNWDAKAGRLGGGYFVAAEPIAGGVRLAYLPAYFLDCGWSGAKCLLRLRGGCNPHAGDSEVIFIDLLGSPSHGEWKAHRVFLSAHCFGHSDGRCRWFDVGEFEWTGESARVWVAEGKNANYPSKSACDSGHWNFDTCDRNGHEVRFPVELPSQNIGSASHPFPDRSRGSDCVEASEIVGAPQMGGTECVWTDSAFRGWAGPGVAGATGYAKYLKLVAGFTPKGTT
jgi:hypothetical protein